jgi:thioredoxin reductase (NADPH)
VTEEIPLVVVGAGPCGLAVGVAARQAGLDCLLFDRGSVVRSIVDYPTQTVFFSGAEKLEIGGVPFTTASDKPTRREALRYYRRVTDHFDLRVRQYEEVEELVRAEAGGFLLRTRDRRDARHEVRARRVVIATGYFDTPNRLEVPGAELSKVSYAFHEPYPYFRQDVLVVGGGNSAADAALSCWREGARVTMVHFGDQLDRGVKPWVRPDIENRISEGSIPMFWGHRVAAITPESVDLVAEDGAVTRLPNDWVLAMIGYVPDPRLLRMAGARVDEITGEPAFDPQSMETEVPGLHVAGVLVAGRDPNRIFIENGKEHGERIVRAILSAEAYNPR